MNAAQKRAGRITLDGVIVVDKPEGWTSHDVVSKVRRIARTKKVGHLGTLDPIATGVLPLVIGRATRLAQFYTRSDKIYEGVVRFGWSTDTYDRAGEATSEKTEVEIDAGELERALEKFRGEFMQTPPPVSAKKVAGKRAYELARESVAVELEPVKVHMYELTLVEVNGAVRASAGALLGRNVHALGRARPGPDAGLRRASATNCAARPAANSKSSRRGPLRNWNRWRRTTGWWTPWCRRRKCCPAFRACAWTS